MLLELELDIGEDDYSYQQHMTAIDSEMLKCRPNMDLLKDLMKRTLFRRVAQMKGPTAEVMGMFPFLKVPNLVSKHCYICCSFKDKIAFTLNTCVVTMFICAL